MWCDKCFCLDFRLWGVPSGAVLGLVGRAMARHRPGEKGEKFGFASLGRFFIGPTGTRGL